jgi:hypothetical protein
MRRRIRDRFDFIVTMVFLPCRVSYAMTLVSTKLDNWSDTHNGPDAGLPAAIVHAKNQKYIYLDCSWWGTTL